MNLYSRRDLSFRGKCHPVVELLLGRRDSRCQTIVNKLAFPFLWNSKPEALQRDSLLNVFADGGLNIIDIKTKIESLFVKQVLQLIKEPSGPSWQCIGWVYTLKSM